MAKKTAKEVVAKVAATTKEQLKGVLTKLGVKFKSKATKAELEELVKANEKPKKEVKVKPVTGGRPEY
jgi:uncharacterized alkaline shock family protein YloU